MKNLKVMFMTLCSCFNLFLWIAVRIGLSGRYNFSYSDLSGFVTMNNQENIPLDDNPKYTVFDLSKLAFNSCTDEQKNDYYKKFKNMPRGLDCYCSKQLLNIIKTITNEDFDAFGDRQGMLEKYENISGPILFMGEQVNICDEAASKGHLDCLMIAHEMGCPWDELTCIAAATYGHLECLMYARENGCEYDDSVMVKAVENGHLDCLKYLHESGIQMYHNHSYYLSICSTAAKFGHLDLVKYAHENGCYCDEYTCCWAAKNGHLEILKYAHENNSAWNELTCCWAAESGNFECLKYAHENGCPWNETTCRWAAKSGHLNCLQYAHENGCEWDGSTCAYATMSGNLECLKYAVDNGCPLNHEQCILYGKHHPLDASVQLCVKYIKSLLVD